MMADKNDTPFWIVLAFIDEKKLNVLALSMTQIATHCMIFN